MYKKTKHVSNMFQQVATVIIQLCFVKLQYNRSLFDFLKIPLHIFEAIDTIE